MNISTFLARAFLALAITAVAVWFLSTYGLRYPPDSTVEPGASATSAGSSTGGERQPAPAQGSLAFSHRAFLRALSPHLRERHAFACPKIEELGAESRAALAALPPEAAHALVRPFSPAGVVAPQMISFQWEGFSGRKVQVHLYAAGALAGPPLLEFPISPPADLYPANLPPLTSGVSYAFRLVWPQGQSALIPFELASEDQQRDYELARQALTQVGDPVHRRILSILLAHHLGRRTECYELARDAFHEYPEDGYIAPLWTIACAQLGFAPRQRD